MPDSSKVHFADLGLSDLKFNARQNELVGLMLSKDHAFGQPSKLGPVQRGAPPAVSRVSRWGVRWP